MQRHTRYYVLMGYKNCARALSSALSSVILFSCASRDPSRNPAGRGVEPVRPYFPNRVQSGGGNNLNGFLEPGRNLRSAHYRGPQKHGAVDTRGVEANAPSCPVLSQIPIDGPRAIMLSDLLFRTSNYKSPQNIPIFSESIESDRMILRGWLLNSAGEDDELIEAMSDSPAFAMALQYVGLLRAPSEASRIKSTADYLGGARMAAVIVAALAGSKYPGCAEWIFENGIKSFQSPFFGTKGPDYAAKLRLVAETFKRIHGDGGNFEQRYEEITGNWRKADEEILAKEAKLDELLENNSENLRFVEMDIRATFKIFKTDLQNIKYCDSNVFNGAFSSVPRRAVGEQFASLLERCNQSLDQDIRLLQSQIDSMLASKNPRHSIGVNNMKEREVIRLQKRMDSLKSYQAALNRDRDSLITTLATLDELVQKKNKMYSQDLYRDQRREIAMARDQRRKLAENFIVYRLYAESYDDSYDDSEEPPYEGRRRPRGRSFREDKERM